MIRFLTISVFIFFSCGLGINKKSEPLNQSIITFETLAQDFYGGMTESKFMTIKNKKDLDTLYNLINTGKIPKSETPKINFDKETVVALFLGERTSGGYSIWVENVLSVNNIITINYKIKTPKRGEMVTSVMTQPYYIIKIPKVINELVFRQLEF